MFTTKPLSTLLLVAALGCPLGACHQDGAADAKARVVALAPSYQPKLAELGTTIKGLTARAAAIPADVPGAVAVRESVFELKHALRSLNIYLAEVPSDVEAASKSGKDAGFTSLEGQIRAYMDSGIAELTAGLPIAAAALAALEKAAVPVPG